MEKHVSLELFLEHVRLQGIYVGAFEIRNLQAVFLREPELSRIELLNIFQVILAKNDLQRNTIRNIFEQMIPYEFEYVENIRKDATGDKKSTMAEFDVKKKRLGVKIGKEKFINNGGHIYFLFMFLIFGVIFFFGGEYGQLKNNAIHANISNSVSLDLLVLSMLCLTLLIYKVYKDTRLGEVSSAIVSCVGKSFIPPVKNELKAYLLGTEERKKIRSAVNYYVSDTSSRLLNINDTVHNTAIKGVPVICFDGAIFKKKIWLWQDQLSHNQNLIFLVDEIILLLKGMNIYVHQGYFQGIPSSVSNLHGDIIWSLVGKQQYFDDSDLVMVFCDSDNLLKEGETLPLTFQELSKIANLAIINCNFYDKELCKVLENTRIKCLFPSQIGDWLGNKIYFNEMNQLSIYEDLHRLAIACSLPERQILEDEIRILHDVLQLNCIWFYDELQRYAEKTSFGLNFEKSRRGLLQEFSRMALSDSQGFHLILDFWIKRSTDIDEQLSKQETLRRPWSNSRRQRQLELEIALLEIWRTPEKAAEKIYSLLCNHELSGTVKKKMQIYSCQYTIFDISGKIDGIDDMKNKIILEHKQCSEVQLPFFWNKLSLRTQKQLMLSGFSGMENNGFLSIDTISLIISSVLLGIISTSLFQMLF